MTQRVLIVGWDGGTWRVFRPLAEKGVMPRLKALMDRGSFGVMTSTIPPLTPPAWTTLMTGVNPGTHGIFGFMEDTLPAESRRDVLESAAPVSAMSLKHRTLVDILGDAGRKSMVVNVPMSYPPRPLNGIMITGMLTPSDAVEYTYPPELTNELTDYAIDVVHSHTIRERGELEQGIADVPLVRICTDVTRRRAENIVRIGKTHAWDFAIVVFTGTDRVSHRLWTEIVELVGKDAPTTEMEQLLLTFYRELDRALGRLVDAFPDATVMIMSDHGFGPRAEHTVIVDACLEEKGFLVRKPGKGVGHGLRRVLRQSVRKTIETLLPRKLALKLFRRAVSRQSRMLALIDVEKSVARFENFGSNAFGGVRLLDPPGTQRSEESRRALIAEIATALGDMRDPETDEPVVVDVHRREELFPGPVRVFLPDLVINFREGYTGRTDPFTTELIGPPPVDTSVGLHRIEGMFLLAGKPFAALGEVGPLHLADVAPTVLYLCGLAVPTRMEGAPPTALLTDAYLQAHPVERCDDGEDGVRPDDERTAAYSEEQVQQVKDHLRHLGYMD